MRAIEGFAVRIADLLECIVEAALMVLMPTLTIVVVAQVIARYVVKQPLVWSEEAARYMLIWVVYLGMTVAIRRHGHMGFTALRQMLPPRIRGVLVIVSQTLVGVVLISLLVGGVRVSTANAAQKSPGLGISTGFVYAAVPVGSLVGIIQLLPIVLRSLQSKDF